MLAHRLRGPICGKLIGFHNASHALSFFIGFVAWGLKRMLQKRKTMNTADIFRWAIMFAVNTQWIFGATFSLQNALKQNLMQPFITKVISVMESHSFTRFLKEAADPGECRVILIATLIPVAE